MSGPGQTPPCASDTSRRRETQARCTASCRQGLGYQISGGAQPLTYRQSPEIARDLAGHDAAIACKPSARNQAATAFTEAKALVARGCAAGALEACAFFGGRSAALPGRNVPNPPRRSQASLASTALATAAVAAAALPASIAVDAIMDRCVAPL